MPGAKIVDVRNALIDLHDKYTIHNLYLQVGSNEIPEKDPYAVAGELSKFLAEIRLYLPHTKLFVSAVLPKIDSSYLPGINDINYLLCSACNYLGIVFVQHQTFCIQGRIRFDMFAFDQIHMNRHGIAQLENDIKALARSFR